MSIGVNKVSENESEALYALKGIAILSVATAHCAGYSDEVAIKIDALLGTIGVPIFLVLAGVFFDSGKPRGEFWKKKFYSIIIPWLIWGGITYAISCFLGEKDCGLEALLKWVLGTYTWLYYVPVLLLCFVIFRISSSSRYVCITILIGIFVNVFTIIGLHPNTAYFTMYQNVFNWVPFFGLGILFGRYGLVNVIMHWNKKLKFFLYAVLGVVAFLYVCVWTPDYWTPLSILFEFFCILAGLAMCIDISAVPLLVSVGKLTYPIYFSHMQIGIGVVNKLFFNKVSRALGSSEVLIVLLRPVLVVLVVYLLIIVGRRLAYMVRCEKLLWLLGIPPLENKC